MIEKLTVAEIEELFKWMAEEGLIRDTGKRRKGLIVYALTWEGKLMAEIAAMTEQTEQ
jgi:hypothetical protein